MSLIQRKANRLAEEQSPYLLQHAYNPVDWYPWGEEAFEKARRENKPILVSIGYAACHWCHVMERESFENEATAELMNREFVNIKVDREERPDVDHIYMDAVQAITGSGGWPLNVFLTPDLRPFYGGTYFPPKAVFNRPSWTDVLNSLAQAYKSRKAEILEQAAQLTHHVNQGNKIGSDTNSDPATLLAIHKAADQLMHQADRTWGGFGKAPKFPQTFVIRFLMAHAHFEKKQVEMDQCLLSLNKMMEGGIYDQVGGGFARYSTDESWLAPHFEKMLYDNALLISALADAFQITQDQRYATVIDETVGFVLRELYHQDGGFYSALDADSEGEEGRFYIWTEAEIRAVLGNEADIFCAFYDVSKQGNWEGHNILRILKDKKVFASENNLDPALLEDVLSRGKTKLLEVRNKRIHPQLDDKVLLGWNALMNSALCQAYAATGEKKYLELALRNMEFIWKAFSGDQFFHTWKEGRARLPAFLDDYACLIEALVDLSMVTGNAQWLEKAASLTEKVIEGFSDEEDIYFYFTHKDQKDILLRKKELYDGATPSGNSVMARQLYRLGILLDRTNWQERALNMVTRLGEIPLKYAASFSGWLNFLYEIRKGTVEIAITGEAYQENLKEVLELYIPYRVIMAAEGPVDNYPLLAGKEANRKTNMYVCKNYACLRPVHTIAELKALL